MTLTINRSMNTIDKNYNLYEFEIKAIPINNAQEVLDYLPFGNTIRVMFGVLMETGCRLSELKNMEINKLYGNHLFWKVGKNQKGYRSVIISDTLVSEINYYRANNRVYSKRMFGISGKTLRRMFNRDVRQHLSDNWKILRFTDFQANVAKKEYLLQLRGARKTWATLRFYKYYKQYNDANLALEFTSRDMKHSSKGITAYHYIKNFEVLDIEQMNNLEINKILHTQSQKRILNYL